MPAWETGLRGTHQAELTGAELGWIPYAAEDWVGLGSRRVWDRWAWPSDLEGCGRVERWGSGDLVGVARAPVGLQNVNDSDV